MDLRRLRALLAGVDTGSVTAAAEEVGYTPSAIASTSPDWNVRRAACYWTTGSTSYAGWGAARWRPQKRRAGRAPIPTLGLALLHEEVVARCLHRDREAVRHAWVVTRPALRGRAAVEAMLQALQAAAATAATHSGAGAVTGRRRLS